MARKQLSPEDKALWDKVRRTVRPLKSRSLRDELAAQAATPQGDASPQTSASALTAGKRSPAPLPVDAVFSPQPKPRTAPRAAAALEPRLKRRLLRGRLEPDARIDLHGMTQQRAHDRLLAFLGGAQARGHVLVLVITGKGRSEGEGVLKTMVPRWLAEPAFRELVVAYEHASRHHGGDGALYVRLRRRGPNSRRPDGGAGAANRLASLPKWST
ncbi:hypothetical protein CKO32_07425 [Afifella marina DSM 2698]|nr:Smr/MutS family protein [Afifella marina]MBK1623392.1 hypothetical protein [Afifella marina DSM 2698]MBK1626386.1 hypothetical protein [Afifella marina]MBK5917264.1 hypothetical protein [Afifella marina]RAI18082.1 hypothetical protein CH311_16570 [Afifella marina DSM 2698]